MTENSAEQANLPDHIEESIHALAVLHAEHHRRVHPVQRVVDRAVGLVGRPRFVAILTACVATWIALNLVLKRHGAAFDAPPFPILQGLAQLVALYLTVLILIRQRHENEMTDRREQLTLELALLSEQKNAKIVELIEEMRRDNPMLKDRVDSNADALSIPADPRTVLDAIKHKQRETLAALDAETADRPHGAPSEEGTWNRTQL